MTLSPLTPRTYFLKLSMFEKILFLYGIRGTHVPLTHYAHSHYLCAKYYLFLPHTYATCNGLYEQYVLKLHIFHHYITHTDMTGRPFTILFIATLLTWPGC